MHCQRKSLAAYDLIVVGLPPLEQGPAFRLAAQNIDGILLVIQWGGVDRERIERALKATPREPRNRNSGTYRAQTAAQSRFQPDTPGQRRKAPTQRLRRSGAFLGETWQVKDSNLRSFRDGFTVRSHWPLGQPAGAAGQAHNSAEPYRTGRAWIESLRQDGPMADSSFDIVSKLDRQEVDNALGQTAREVATRFDFKGTGATIEWKGEKAIEITASADDRASAVLTVFQEKLIKRGVSLKVLDADEPRQSGQQSKIAITLKDGITSEDAKKVAKLIRDEGPKKVKAQIQGEELRVSSSSRDDLQAVQALVKGADLDFPVQFVNYR